MRNDRSVVAMAQLLSSEAIDNRRMDGIFYAQYMLQPIEFF